MENLVLNVKYQLFKVPIKYDVTTEYIGVFRNHGFVYKKLVWNGSWKVVESTGKKCNPSDASSHQNCIYHQCQRTSQMCTDLHHLLKRGCYTFFSLSIIHIWIYIVSYIETAFHNGVPKNQNIKNVIV